MDSALSPYVTLALAIVALAAVFGNPFVVVYLLCGAIIGAIVHVWRHQ